MPCLSYGYTSNFSPAIAMRFSEITALPSRRKIATQLHGAMAKFADKRTARILRVFNISAAFQRYFIASARHAGHRNCTCDGNAVILETALPLQVKIARVAAALHGFEIDTHFSI